MTCFSARGLSRALLMAICSAAGLLLWSPAGEAATISNISSLSAPATIFSGTSAAAADSVVFGPQSIQITFATPLTIPFNLILSISNALFATPPTVTWLGTPGGCTPQLTPTAIVFSGCGASGGTTGGLVLNSLNYTHASALNLTNTSILLSGSITTANLSATPLDNFPATAVVTAPFSLSAPSAVNTQCSSDAVIPVTLLGSASNTVTVDYVTQSGTAIAGTDYTPTSGTLTYSPGQIAQNITVPTLNTCAGSSPLTYTVVFSNVTGGATINNASLTVTIAAPTASYFALSTSKLGTGSGTIAASPQALTYASGTGVTLTATPSNGTVFAGWSGAGCSGTAPTCQFTMNANKAVTATFNLAIANSVLRQGAVFSTTQSTSQSFLRFYNAGATAGTVTVTLYNSTTGQAIATWTSPSILPGAAPQFPISSLESAVPAGVTKPSFYTASIQSQFTGTFQHVLWKPGDGTLTNLSTCDAGVADISTRVANVHSSVLGGLGYPSQIVVNNTGGTAASATLVISNASDASLLGTYQTASIPPNGDIILTIPAIENGGNIAPASAVPHYVITLQAPFTGYLQHLINNIQVGVVTDMSTVCAFLGS